MIRNTIHRLLAKSTEKIGCGLLRMAQAEALIAESLTEAGKWHQRACPLSAPLMLEFTLLMSLYRRLSLPSVLAKVVGALRMDETQADLPLRPVTPEALCHARKRLGIDPVKILFAKIADRLQPTPSFHGYRTWGVDGVRFRLPDTKSNESFFGRPTASRGAVAFPQMQAVALVDTTSRQVKRCSFDRCDSGELKAFQEIIKPLGDGDLLLMDRGFAGGWLFDACRKRGINILVRIASSWKPKKLVNMGPGDWLVRLASYHKRPAHERRQGNDADNRERRDMRTKLVLRMIEYRIGRNKTVRLLTSLVDFEAITAREIAALYHQRWECEIVYDEQKTHLAAVPHGKLAVPFRSKTPDGVLQEAFGMLAAYNLIRFLMAKAGNERSIPCLELSFEGTLLAMDVALLRLHAGSERHYRQVIRQLFNDIAAARLKRPRRKVAYPRCVRIKMSNFKLKGRSASGQRRDFLAELVLPEFCSESEKAA